MSGRRRRRRGVGVKTGVTRVMFFYCIKYGLQNSALVLRSIVQPNVAECISQRVENLQFLLTFQGKILIISVQ